MARSSAIAALASLALLALSANAHASHVQCGEVITEDMTLDSSLVDCPGDGVRIAADGVTLDLDGHTIDGVGNGAGVTVSGRVELHDLEVLDGTVQGFGAGILFEEVGDVTVRRVHVVENEGRAIGCVFAGGCQFVDNVVVRNGGGLGISMGELGTRTNLIQGNLIAHNGSGIGIGYDGAQILDNRIVDNHSNGIGFGAGGGLVRGNEIVGNRLDGVHAFDQSGPSVVGNLIARNGEDGIDLLWNSEGGDFSGNRVLRNAGYGIRIGAEAGWDTAIWSNLVSRNGFDGIFVDAESSRLPVSDNRADRNGDDGIDVEAPGTTVSANRADHNVDLGIEAVPGVIDGGGNGARHNGNATQCLNVACGK